MMRPDRHDHARDEEWRDWGLALGGQLVQILLLLCTVYLISWVIISDPSQNETLSSRLEYRVGTVVGDFWTEWHEQQSHQPSSTNEYLNSTTFGDPLQAAGVSPWELGHAPSAAGLAVADGSQGVCLAKGLATAVPSSVCCLVDAGAQTAGSAGQSPATAAAQGTAPQDRDAAPTDVLQGAAIVSAQAGSAQPSAVNLQQLGGQQAVITLDSAGSEQAAEHPAHAVAEPAAPGASVQQGTAAEPDTAAIAAAAGAVEPVPEVSTALQETQGSHSSDVLGSDSSADLRTGLQEEDIGTAVTIKGMQDSHAGAVSTVQDASTPELQAPAAGLSTGLLELSAVRPLANLTGKLGAYSAQLWGLVLGQKSARAAAGAGAEQSTFCELHQGLLEAHAPAEAAGVCGPAQQDSADAHEVDGVQEQHEEHEQQGQQELQEHQAYQALPDQQEQLEQPEVAPLGLHSSDLPAGAFLTPGVMYEAYQRTGLVHTVLYAFCTLAVAAALRSICNWVGNKLSKKRSGLAWLPNNIKSDPKAVEAFFTLRDLFFKQSAWWQLVGVSGVAVCQAEGARQQADSIAGRLEGGARFARQLLRQQRRRMLDEHDSQVDELRAAFDEQLAQQDAAHVAVVEQHLQKQAQQQLTIVEQSEDRAKLGAEVRQKNEALAAMEAIISRLESDLEKSEQGKQQLQRDFDQFLQRSAKGEGFAAALKLQVKEVIEREQTLNSKFETAQQQLSEANSTISQLRAEVQHKQESIAARDASCRQLEDSRQQLQQDKEQLQQQLLVLMHERDDVRAQAAALQEGKDQLQKLNSQLQQEFTSLQALHAQQKLQLREEQGAYDALQQQSRQLHADLAAASEREAGLSSKLQEQQQALDEQGQRAQELQAQLDSQRNQHDQTRIKLQHEVVQRQTAEESLRHERAEKQAAVAKADGLQLQLTLTTQELSLLKADHVAATQTLQRVQEDFAELSQQHKDAQALITSNEQQIASLQERLAQRDRQLSVQDKQLSEDLKQLQQLQQQVAELQQQAAKHIAEAEMQAMDRDQLIKEMQEERQKLADSRRELQAAGKEVEDAWERCAALEQQLEEKQEKVEQLGQDCEFQQAKLKALQAELEQRKRAIEVAQRDLNEAMEKYDYEDHKNRELGAENGKLQRQVLNLEEHERQLTEELDECIEQLEQLTSTHAGLQAQGDALKEQSDALVDRQAALLDENTARTAELQEKLREAEADMAALTRERDDLEKKLYFAEMARDQTQQAKALAAEDAVKARQALTEEKLRKTVARTMSTPSGRGAVAASVAGGEVSSSRPWQRTNSSVPAKKWGTVEPAYLHQHYKDPKDGTIRRCGSPTGSMSNSESTPGTPRSTATSGDGGSTQRGRRLLASTPSNASAAVQQLEGAFDEADTDAAAAANSPRARSLSSEGSHHGSLVSARLRRVSAVSGSPRSRLQECSSHQQEQLDMQQQEQQQRQQQEHQQHQAQENGPQLLRSNSTGSSTGSASPSPGRTVAAAAAGLRSNFTDAGGSVAGSPAAVAAAAVDGAVAEGSDAAVQAAEQGSLGSPSVHQTQESPQQQEATTVSGSDSPETQQQQQQHLQEPSPGPASTATATPPLEQGGNSPSLCSNGTKSRLSLADMRDMRPLALSPVQQSSDLVLTGLDADSPGVTSSLGTSLSRLAAASLAGASILDAVAPTAAGPARARPATAVSASLTLAAIAPAAAAAGSDDGVLVSVPSAVSAPATPAAAAAAGAGDGAADGLQFFTPLATAHSSGSSSSVAECSSPVFAAAAVAHAEPATPYFTPTHGAAAAAATADSAASDTAVGNSALPAEAAAGDGEESAADAAGQPSSSTAGTEPAAPAAAVAAAGGGGDVVDSNADGNPPLAPRVADGASHYNTSSFVPQVDDADVVLIGSLSEADFAGLGLAGSQHDLQQQLLQDLPVAGEVQAAEMPSMEQQQQQEQLQHQHGVHEEQCTAVQLDVAVVDSNLASAAGKEGVAVTAGSTRSSHEHALNGRAAAVPRLPLFQLHAAGAAAGAGAGPALAPNSSRASAGVTDWELDSDELSEDDMASSGSSSGEPAPTADDDCGDAGDSCQEDTAAVSDLESTPPKMFIGNMPPAAAVAAAAAVGVSGSMHSPRAVQHSPRYHDQRAMHSPRYPNQQQQQHSPRYLNQQQQQQQQQAEQEAMAAAADAEGSESDSDDLAGESSMPDAAPRSKPSSPAAGAAAGAANMRSSRNSKSLRSSRGSPGTSPRRPTSAGAAGNSPPSAGAAAGSGALKYQRRSSRLSDPASSSCSSIKSLVAQSRQQQQQQLRRTGSNNSIGTAAVAAGFMSVLDAGAGAGSPRSAVRRSGSLDQQGFAKAFSVKQQQQQGRSRRGSAGNSPTRSCIAAVAANKPPSAAAAASAAGGSGDLATMQVLRSSRGSDDSVNCGSQDQQQRQQLYSPIGTCSPQPSTSSLAGFSTPPGPFIRPAKAATVGPPGMHGQQKSTVMWKSLDDFVRHNQAPTSHSTHSSPGNRQAGGIGSSSMAGLPPFLSPPAAVLANPWASPAAAAAQGLPGLPPSGSARASYALSPQGSVGGKLGSPACVTPMPPTAAGSAAARVSREGSAGFMVGVPVLPVAEGVCEGASEADTPNSCISGDLTAEGSPEEGRADSWTVQENPVYFDLQ